MRERPPLKCEEHGRERHVSANGDRLRCRLANSLRVRQQKIKDAAFKLGDKLDHDLVRRKDQANPVSAAFGFARADGAAQRCRGPPRTKLAWHGLHRVIFDGVASIHLNLHQLAKSRDLSRRTVKRLIVRAARVARDARAEKWRVALQRAGLRTPLGEPPRDPFSLAVFCLPARERAVLFLARLQECTQTRARLFSAERSPVTAQPAFGHLRRLTCRRLRRQRRHVCTSR